jgi:hypothetical protein
LAFRKKCARVWRRKCARFLIPSSR